MKWPPLSQNRRVATGRIADLGEIGSARDPSRFSKGRKNGKQSQAHQIRVKQPDLTSVEPTDMYADWLPSPAHTPNALSQEDESQPDALLHTHTHSNIETRIPIESLNVDASNNGDVGMGESVRDQVTTSKDSLKNMLRAFLD